MCWFFRLLLLHRLSLGLTVRLAITISSGNTFGRRALVTLQRCVCGQRIDYSSGCERHTYGRCLEEPECDCGIRRSELWEEGEADESHGAGGDATTGHVQFADFGKGAAHIAALKKCADNTDGSYELAVLRVIPVKHYTNRNDIVNI